MPRPYTGVGPGASRYRVGRAVPCIIIMPCPSTFRVMGAGHIQAPCQATMFPTPASGKKDNAACCFRARDTSLHLTSGIMVVPRAARGKGGSTSHSLKSSTVSKLS